jgi:hypothetical protein
MNERLLKAFSSSTYPNICNLVHEVQLHVITQFMTQNGGRISFHPQFRDWIQS